MEHDMTTISVEVDLYDYDDVVFNHVINQLKRGNGHRYASSILEALGKTHESPKLECTECAPHLMQTALLAAAESTFNINVKNQLYKWAKMV
jgi:hypothetical protein